MSFSHENLLAFWFYEIGPSRWFEEDPALDALLREHYTEACEAAARGEYKKLESTPEGMVALLLLLDIFPQRIYRGTAKAFENEDLIVDLTRNAIIKHFDDRIDKTYKLFFYLPFQHSEHEGDQRLALFYIRERTKEDSWLQKAEKAYETIMRFGRFPERNEALGRESTPEELEYLKALKESKA